MWSNDIVIEVGRTQEKRCRLHIYSLVSFNNTRNVGSCGPKVANPLDIHPLVVLYPSMLYQLYLGSGQTEGLMP